MAEKKEKSFWDEFKEFAVKGSVIDLAVGVVIGGAFAKITSSFVTDIITPPLGIILGSVDFNDRFVALSTRHFNTVAQAKAAGIATINYGVFISNIIEFLIVALVIFIVIKQINKLKRIYAYEPESHEKKCPFCTKDIDIKATRCPYCTSELGVRG